MNVCISKTTDKWIKRWISLLLCLLLSVPLTPHTVFAAPSWPSNISISAEGGIVMDANSGTVLYGKNVNSQYYPASITKILTALIVIENCDMNEIVTFSHNAVYNVEAGSSSAGLDEGDQLTVRDTLYAMMLKSANEAANALAEHVAGSIEAFAEKMNEKAASLGCTDSNFKNPSGLNDPEHYTSAYDMALISQAAFQNDSFVEIDSTLYYDIPPTKRNPEGIRVYPGHKMLKKNASQYYPGIIGGKTGYTSLAGNTLVTCAERDGMKLIAVVLNGHQTHYTDTKALLDFGFRNFKSLDASEYDTTYTTVKNDMTIAGLPTTDLSILQMQKHCRITLPADAEFSDADSSISYDLPVSAPNNAIAHISYAYGDRQIGSTYLVYQAPTSETRLLTDVSANSVQTAAVQSPETEASSTDSAEGMAGFTDGIPGLSGNSRAAAEPNADSGTTESSGGSEASFFSGEHDPSGNSGHADNSRSFSEPKSSGFRIPAIIWILAAVILVSCGAFVGIRYLKSYLEKQEEEERLARKLRREQRLQDLGMSSAEFELLMKEKRENQQSGRSEF